MLKDETETSPILVGGLTNLIRDEIRPVKITPDINENFNIPKQNVFFATDNFGGIPIQFKATTFAGRGEVIREITPAFSTPSQIRQNLFGYGFEQGQDFVRLIRKESGAPSARINELAESPEGLMFSGKSNRKLVSYYEEGRLISQRVIETKFTGFAESGKMAATSMKSSEVFPRGFRIPKLSDFTFEGIRSEGIARRTPLKFEAPSIENDFASLRNFKKSVSDEAQAPIITKEGQMQIPKATSRAGQEDLFARYYAQSETDFYKGFGQRGGEFYMPQIERIKLPTAELVGFGMATRGAQSQRSFIAQTQRQQDEVFKPQPPDVKPPVEIQDVIERQQFKELFSFRDLTGGGQNQIVQQPPIEPPIAPEFGFPIMPPFGFPAMQPTGGASGMGGGLKPFSKGQLRSLLRSQF